MPTAQQLSIARDSYGSCYRPAAQVVDGYDPHWMAYKCRENSETLGPYWTFRDGITVKDNIALKGQCIIVPSSMQRSILTKLHADHRRTADTELRARTAVYWRGMNSDIDSICKTCRTCQEMQISLPKEPLL